MIKPYEMSYIRTLRDIAKNLDNGLRCKHSSMLTNKSGIISMGVNKAKSDPFQKINSNNHKNASMYQEYSWVHAEVDCLKGFVKEDLRRSTIYVIRTDRNGNLMESCPCAGCRSLIDNLEIPRIVHSNVDGGLTVIHNGV